VPPVDLTAPRIADYELLRLVGRGAYGDVWLARSVTGIFRAVKVVWRDRFPDAQPYEREFNGLREFARISLKEARQLALLHVGRNDDDSFFYYVMELADDVESGRTIDPARYAPLTLKRFLQQERRLNVVQVVNYAIEVCRALGSLHAHGLVHRDIKPSNIIIVDGLPKLADIGLVASTSEAITFVGTEGYVPPEGPGTPAADVYSFGKVLYELATGRDRNDYPRLPEDLRARADRVELMELNEVIVRACDPSSEIRYANADAMLKELLLLQAGRSVRRLRLTERGLARARRVVVGLALVAAVAFGGMYFERQRALQETQARKAAETERDEVTRFMLYSAALARAQRALETYDYGRARELLLAYRSTLTPAGTRPPFEWRALWQLAQGDEARVVRDRGHSIHSIYFSPDGRTLGIHDQSRTITLYRAEDFTPIRTIPGVYRWIGFSADGLRVIGSDSTQKIRVWDATDGRALGAAIGSGFNHPVCMVPGQREHLLVVNQEAPEGPIVLRLLDLETGSASWEGPLSFLTSPLWQYRASGILIANDALTVIMRQERTPEAPVLAAFTLQYGRLNEEGGPENARSLFYAHSLDEGLQQVAAQLTDHPDSNSRDLLAIAYSPDASLLAASSQDGRILIADATTADGRGFLLGHHGAVVAAAWSPNGEWLITGDSSGHVRAWREPFLPASKHLQSRPETGDEKTMVFSPDGTRLVLASHFGGGQTFDTTEERKEADSLRKGDYFAGFLHDGTVVTLNDDGGVTFLGNHRSKRVETELPWTAHETRWGAVDGEGRQIVAISKLNELFIQRFGEAAGTHPSPLSNLDLRGFSLSPSGRILAAVEHGVTLRTWHLPAGAPDMSAQILPPIHSVAFAPDESLIALAIRNGEVVLIDLATGQTAQTLKVGSSAAAIAFSPEGDRLVCATRDGLIHVYRTRDWSEVATLSERELIGDASMAPTHLAFSPDGGRLAIRRRDGRILLWDSP
jgi:WD40 repeat protein